MAEISRRVAADRLGVPKRALRDAEADGVLPLWGGVTVRDYERAVRTWQAARRGGA